MPTFTTNDAVTLHYETYGSSSADPLILTDWLTFTKLHGFTGSGKVFQRNFSALSRDRFVLVPDLRGHGDSDKPKSGFHVARLAMDLKNLIDHFKLHGGKIAAIGTSLGAAILWCYAELFGTKAFSHMIFVDQAPLQNYLPDWGPEYGNRGCNSPEALLKMQQTLETVPKEAHLGTIAACLGYRAYPQPGDPTPGSKIWEEDVSFFLGEASKGDGWWYGKLMADHTAKDWRFSIAQNFGPSSASMTKIFVIASTRSGCFPAAGPLKVVDLVNGQSGSGLAQGVTVEWGGHWCYWERPDIFNKTFLDFLSK